MRALSGLRGTSLVGVGLTMAVVGTLVATPAAHASVITGGDAVASDSDGRLEVFNIAPDGSMRHNYQVVPNGGWSGWSVMPCSVHPAFTAVPAAGRNADGRLEVFAFDPAGEVWHIWQTVPNGGWSCWDNLGGGFDASTVGAGRLAVGQNADGRLEIFAENGQYAVWHNYQVIPNGGWGGWSNLGNGSQGSPVSGVVFTENGFGPVVASKSDGRLEVFAQGQDRNYYHNYQIPGSGWSGWAGLGGANVALGPLAVGQNADGRLELFVGTLHNYQIPGRGRSGWSELG